VNSVTRIFDIPYWQKEKTPRESALVAKENGKWTGYSTDQLISNAEKFAMGLIAIGLNRGDSAAIISANRPEWNMADFGMQMAGVINVPLYVTLSESEIIFILNDCKAKYIFAGDILLTDKILKLHNKVPSLKGVFSFDKNTGAPHWSEITYKGQTEGDRDKMDAIKKAILTDDVATVLYTSGTTGTPKGVMLTHRNIISNVQSCESLFPVEKVQKALSFLPLCHSYERMLTYVYMYLGTPIYYAESMDKIADNLREIKPQAFSTVPRLLEKVFDRIMAKGNEQKGIKRMLFFRAVELGLKYEFNGKNGAWYEMQLAVLNKLVFSKWREALGGNVKVVVSGGAALQPRLARIFWAANIPVLEGYGLTETSPVISVNNFEKNGVHFGTVGPVVKDVEVKIAEDGEILARGPNIMKGYYNRPDLTAEVIDADGWFHTGDIGTFVENRFLKITDRKKEIFKTSGGKYIAPQGIENKFKESKFIEQIMVVGENQKYASALIVPDFAVLKTWCSGNGVGSDSADQLIKNQKVVSLFRGEVERLNKFFGNTEQIKTFCLMNNEWTVDSGELTATLKLRRKFILDKYKNQVQSLFVEETASAT
jgi:long-chain acyl-CoA synthetase